MRLSYSKNGNGYVVTENNETIATLEKFTLFGNDVWQIFNPDGNTVMFTELAFSTAIDAYIAAVEQLS